MNQLYFLKKTNREVLPFPWDSRRNPQPWPPGYMRVLVPLSTEEKKKSSKKVHCQIVKIDNVKVVRETPIRFG